MTNEQNLKEERPGALAVLNLDPTPAGLNECCRFDASLMTDAVVRGTRYYGASRGVQIHGVSMIHKIVSILQSNGVALERGLDAAEADAVELRYGFKFPDLRALLMQALPVSAEFPDWRHGCERALLSH